MNNICTSIKQAKKLIKLGIDVSTADMYYSNHSLEDYYSPIPHIGNYSAIHNQIPCWSLSALIKILPKGFLLLDDQGESESGLYSVWVPGFNSPHIWKDNSLDAVFEMVCWLLENKKI